jgi:cell division septation protein DedD
VGGLALLAAVAACSGHAPPIDQSQEAARYQAIARGDYHPPGPPEDPWGPYVSEAAGRFDVPERWIREVMRVESGGEMYQNGQLITSRVGAMGLMQVMPETYDELRGRYGLDADAYDPHNNVLAGAAYLREMYDIYGSPGFLAAYNAGPKRLDDYLANLRPLPDETRHYVASIGPYIQDAFPANRSAAEQYAMNDLPIDIPPGLRYGGRTYQYAEARRTPARGGRGSHQTRYASAGHAPVRVAFAELPPAPPSPPPAGKHRGFSLIEPAMAETPTYHRGAAGGGWAVQVGAFGSESQAHAANGAAREKAALGGTAHASVAGVRNGRGTLYRARLGGLSREGAIEACRKLGHCMVLAPNAQS